MQWGYEMRRVQGSVTAEKVETSYGMAMYVIAEAVVCRLVFKSAVKKWLEEVDKSGVVLDTRAKYGQCLWLDKIESRDLMQLPKVFINPSIQPLALRPMIERKGFDFSGR